jgi:hypothetical protein
VIIHPTINRDERPKILTYFCEGVFIQSREGISPVPPLSHKALDTGVDIECARVPSLDIRGVKAGRLYTYNSVLTPPLVCLATMLSVTPTTIIDICNRLPHKAIIVTDTVS